MLLFRATTRTETRKIHYSQIHAVNEPPRPKQVAEYNLKKSGVCPAVQHHSGYQHTCIRPGLSLS